MIAVLVGLVRALVWVGSIGMPILLFLMGGIARAYMMGQPGLALSGGFFDVPMAIIGGIVGIVASVFIFGTLALLLKIEANTRHS